MATRAEAQKYYGEATEAVTDRVRSYGLSLLGTALLLSKQPDESLLDVDLKGAVQVAAIAAGIALALDFLQFVYRAGFWGHQQWKTIGLDTGDDAPIVSEWIPVNLTMISLIFTAKSAALIVSIVSIGLAIFLGL